MNRPRRLADLGGKVVAAPFDVMDAGRMAVIADPTGAMFWIWQAAANPGIGITGVPGTLCWADLNTKDPGYRQSISTKDCSGGNSRLARKTYRAICTSRTARNTWEAFRLLRRSIPNTPPHWMIYLFTADVEEATARITPSTWARMS